MRTPPDHAALMDGLHPLVEMVNGGRAGLPALTQLLTAASGALGARGMTLCEHSPAGVRVVAATGALAWALGRPVTAADRVLGLATSGERTWQTRVAGLECELSQQLRGRGLRLLLATRVERAGELVGGLHAYFADPFEVAGAEHHKVMSFVGSCAAALYGDAGQLPAVGPGAMLVDRDLYVAVTSHELRTPVTVIKGFADTLNQYWDTLPEAGRREAVEVIGQRTSELARLVDRLLATTTEPGALVCAPFNPVGALRRAVDELSADLRRRLRVALPPTLPDAYGDQASLATVLTELVTNAAKYSSSEVELAAAADAQNVLVRVADRGIGIAPEHAERAFDRYWQGESGDRREFAGAGLGLHLVRQVIERQHGWISLRPRDRGGTVAEVRLLRADATAREPARTADPSPEPVRRTSGRGET